MADDCEINPSVSEECPRARQWAREAFASDVAYLLNQAAEMARSQVAVALAPFGVSPRQMAIMLLLSRHEPLRQHELGALLGIDRTSMVSLIDGLERLGNVVREPDPVDRRAYAVRLTDRGRAESLAISQAVAEAQERLLAPLTTIESAELLRMLAKLTAVDRDDQVDG